MPINLEPFDTIDKGFSYFIQEAESLVEAKDQRKAQCETLANEIEGVDLSIWNQQSLDEYRDRVNQLLALMVESLSAERKYLACLCDSMAALQNGMRNFFDSLDSLERKEEC